MIITTKIIAFLICTAIAYSIALIGKNKKIGFKWAFYLGLLMPLLSLVLSIFSKKQDGIINRESKTMRIVAIVCCLWGTMLLLGGLSTKVDPNTNNISSNIQSDMTIKGDIDTGNTDDDTFLTVLANRIGLYVGGGILSYTVEMASARSNDYKYRRLVKYNTGIILISLGIFLMRNNLEKSILKTNQTE